ncbi:hypothetical protein PsAD2_04274 [Pseudovibrio axinellae]|uniref:Uncharacterized protein n=1 Tax=Pseudovibrio axinellae TaxID=989403 RepID=A0A165T2U6_9HYPH|nr:hypothetical protein [Pseudovibrio axinellae]KZL05349.1 hypothetical protein PsAD2_04274 [Pseudovibrio axinellae]SER84656.1 hypothetical protein SAMN05421798_1361 [Pseudovibrio axinellae]
MRKIAFVLLGLLCIPAPALAHIEVSSIKNIKDINKVKTCKNGINSAEATSGVVKLWTMQKFGGRINVILTGREEVTSNLRGRLGFFIKYILKGDGKYDVGRVFVSTCGTVFEIND